MPYSMAADRPLRRIPRAVLASGCRYAVQTQKLPVCVVMGVASPRPLLLHAPTACGGLHLKLVAYRGGIFIDNLHSSFIRGELLSVIPAALERWVTQHAVSRDAVYSTTNHLLPWVTEHGRHFEAMCVARAPSWALIPPRCRGGLMVLPSVARRGWWLS